MTFAITYSEEALYQLKKLDNQTAKRILDKVKEAATKPRHFFERLRGREAYKLRVGDYRLIAFLFFTEERIFVSSIGHRKIYEK